MQYDEYDNALNVMITHSPIAWEHVKFKDVAVKVKSQEALYKGISFYLEEHPDLLNDLLKVGGRGEGSVSSRLEYSFFKLRIVAAGEGVVVKVRGLGAALCVRCALQPACLLGWATWMAAFGWPSALCFDVVSRRSFPFLTGLHHVMQCAHLYALARHRLALRQPCHSTKLISLSTRLT